MKKIILSLLFVFAFMQTANAEIQIDITGGKSEPLAIAIPDIIGNDAKDLEFGRNIRDVLISDLQRTGLFYSMEQDSFIQKIKSINVRPSFVDWQAINAIALVQAKAYLLEDGKLKVEFRLWDVFSQKQMLGQAFATQTDNWRRISHIIADAIYKRITGEEGYFDTRIVYIAETGPETKRIKRLAIMDQDGENHKFLTDGQAMVLTPRFSPTMQQITYLSYFNNTPRVYLFDIETGRQELVGDFPGMTFAPRFSPDGNKLIMSMALKGNSEIYVMDLKTKRSKRITHHPAIDTSPSYSPDSKKVVFNSDRGGNQQLYVMDSDGRNVKRISFGKGRYATPVWSPRGDYIAFTKILKGKFYIGVMHPDGTGERLITKGYLVEAPTWAPNGRVLMYFRQFPGNRKGKKSKTRIYSVDITGYNDRQVITPVDASDPAWSPLLP
jgi:TolB protein